MDIGAGRGLLSLSLIETFSHIRVLAVEAEEASFTALKKALAHSPHKERLTPLLADFTQIYNKL